MMAPYQVGIAERFLVQEKTRRVEPKAAAHPIEVAKVAFLRISAHVIGTPACLTECGVKKFLK
jgi:hypothetical protein